MTFSLCGVECPPPNEFGRYGEDDTWRSFSDTVSSVFTSFPLGAPDKRKGCKHCACSTDTQNNSSINWNNYRQKANHDLVVENEL
ncbi:hypothetical protein CDAR_2871 [Caerostris darwini]|uniref:Uncharacterized protein n=1 Tax=Caerostris darwini TaxID=1538125 RepID=A0AAV4TIM7_9ARAC|nr:hypothetical protein CDAR_2871 [Caerostris darwini]